MAAFGIRQCLVHVVLFVISLLNLSSASPVLCPAVGRDIFGDLLKHYGCIVLGLDRPEDKMKPTTAPAAEPVLTRMKPETVPLPPSPPLWLEEMSSYLLNSTDLVNNFNENADDSPIIVSVSPQCCRSESRLVYPLYGRSLTNGRLVRIAQELDPNGIQQPVVYRHCLSKKSDFVRGRCHQSTLPRLFYVPAADGGYPYKQDLFLVPSNCECLITLGRRDNDDNDEDDNDAAVIFRHDTNTTVTTLSPPQEQLIEGSGVATALESTVQDDDDDDQVF